MREKKTTNRHTEDVPAFSQQEVKEQGKVYTPYCVVDAMLDQFRPLLTSGQKICDPSCGQGNFLRRIFEQRRQKKVPPNEAFQGLYGFELDAFNLQRAKDFFTSAGVDKALVDKQLIVGNTTMLFLKHLNHFDVILGNPPYVKNPKVPSESSLRLTKNLVDTFCEIGLKMLRPGGHLIYIIQDSFLMNEQSELRDLLRSHNLHTVEYRYDFAKLFRRHSIAVDIALICIQKETKQQPLVHTRRHFPFQLPAEFFPVEQKWLLFPQDLLELNDKLLSSGAPIGDLLTVTKGRTLKEDGTAIPASYSGENYKRIESSTHNIPVLGEPNTDYFFPKSTEPLLWTQKVQLKKNNRRICTEPPFVVLPYYTSRFRFCLVEQDLFACPLLYVLAGPDAEVLLPILNSSVVSFLIRMNTKSRDTSFEFKQSTFKKTIMIPNLTALKKKLLKGFVSQLRSETITTEEVDEWVSKEIYGLSDEQIARLKEALDFDLKKHVKKKVANT